MSPFAGPLFAAAGLLAAAGVAKAWHPGAAAHALRTAGLPGSRPIVRAMAGAEVAIGVAALSIGGRAAALLVQLAYLGFAGFVVRLRAKAGSGASCGCFGAEEAPASPVHVVVNLAVAVLCRLAVGWPSEGLGSVVADSPALGLPFLGFTLLFGWLLFVALTVVPDLFAAKAAASTSGAGR